LLKLYIRGLPDSLFPNEIYLPLLKYFERYTDENSRIKIIQLFLMMIPRNYLILLEYLFDLFNLITKFSEYNQMTSNNLARVFAPNLLKPSSNTEPSLRDYEITTTIIKFIIDHDYEFHISRADNILLKILQEVPDFNSKNLKAKRNNLRIPFMAINNIFSDSEETDDERNSRNSYSNNGEIVALTKHSPQFMTNPNNNNNNVKFSLLLDEKSGIKNMAINKVNLKPLKTAFNAVGIPLTPPQSPSTITTTNAYSSVHPNGKSPLNTITSNSESSANVVGNGGNSENGIKSFNVNTLTKGREATSFSVIRPNNNTTTTKTKNENDDSIPDHLKGMVNATNTVVQNNTNTKDAIIKSDSIQHHNSVVRHHSSIRHHNSISHHDSINHHNSRIINRKNTVEGNDNNSHNQDNHFDLERNNSSSYNKLQSTEI